MKRKLQVKKTVLRSLSGKELVRGAINIGRNCTQEPCTAGATCTPCYMVPDDCANCNPTACATCGDKYTCTPGCYLA